MREIHAIVLCAFLFIWTRGDELRRIQPSSNNSTAAYSYVIDALNHSYGNMKRIDSNDAGPSSSSSNPSLDIPTLAKRAKESGISYRTCQRWAHRGAFDDKLLEDVTDQPGGSSSSDSLTVISEEISAAHNSEISCPESPSSSSSGDLSSSDSEDTSSDSDSSRLEDDHDPVNFHISFDSDREAIQADIVDDSSHGFTKLHDYTNKTVEEAVFSIMTSYIKHNKSRSCLEDDLRILYSVLPTPNNMPKSVYLLTQFVEGYAPPCPIVEYYCCESCQFYYGTSRLEACAACGNKTSNTFYIMSVESQIKYLIEHRSLADELRKANENLNMDASVITDIRDGSEYKRVNSGRKPFDLTLILSTDGAKLKRSSTADFWPISFTVAEVRSSVRHLFITCVGVWYSSKKPDMNTFLRPVAVELKKISKSRGIKWKDPKTGEEFTSKIYSPLIVGDAPVRAAALNHQHHNGKRGCITCEIKTQKVKKNKEKKERRKRVYKFSEECQLRTKARMQVFAKEAERRDVVIRGVKGRTVVSLLPGVDESTVVFGEFMHSMCLGLAKQVLQCWIGKSECECDLKEFIPELDNTMTELKPPSFFSRPPRRVSDNTHWKAYEFLYWTLFYSVFALIELQKKFPSDEKVGKFRPYVEHWLLFVHSAHILMQPKISLTDLDTAEMLINLFVKNFEDLYGDKEMSYNVHQMLHLCLHTRRWGPMADISAFPFESFIGLLGKGVHGNRHVGKEITKKMKISQGVQALGNAIQTRDLARLEYKRDECLGKPISPAIVDTTIRAIVTQVGLSEHIRFFPRARIQRSVYTSKLYQELASIDFCVILKCTEVPSDVSIGTIEVFVQCRDSTYIVMKKFSVNHENLLVCHAGNRNYVVKSFIPVKTNGRDLTVIDVKSIVSIEKLFLHKDFVCVIPKSLRTKSRVM